MNNPKGYSRLIRDDKFNFVGIKEEIECNENELKIPYICGGVYMTTNYQIQDNINKITNNNQESKFHISDLFNIVNPAIYMLEEKFQKELINVNDEQTIRRINN